MNPQANTAEIIALPTRKAKSKSYTNSDITKATVRDKLEPSNTVYYLRVTAGYSLGYRKAIKGADMWYARAWNGKAYDFATWDGTKTHPEVKPLADAWAKSVMEGGGKTVTKLVTVEDLCIAQVAAYREAGRIETADKAEGRFKHLGLMRSTKRDLHALATAKLASLRIDAVAAFVGEMKAGGVKLNTVNRDVTTIRTAFTLGLDKGALRKNQFTAALAKVIDPTTGKVVEDGVRDVYLTPEVRRALIERTPAHYTDFFRVVAGTPIRIGAIAARKAGEWRVQANDEGLLHVKTDKAGAGRHVALFNGVRAVIAARAAGKGADDLLFTNEDGNAINSDNWRYAFDAAVAQCKADGIEVPAGAVPYSFRHSVITDMVTKHIPVLFIAKLSGTSTEMIEKHYAKLLTGAAQAAMAAIEL